MADTEYAFHLDLLQQAQQFLHIALCVFLVVMLAVAYLIRSTL